MYNNDNGRLEREARMEPPIHIQSTSGWLPSHGGCDLFAASWTIVPSGSTGESLITSTLKKERGGGGGHNKG